MPVIGFLHSASPGPFAHLVAAYRQGLKDRGYVEGQNIAVEYRWAEGQFDRLPALATDLVQRDVRLIAALGGSASPFAAKKATATIPIVFSSGEMDPVKSGLVVSLNRPGGNVTGVSPMTGMLLAKRLELLREIAPQAGLVGYLLNSNNPNSEDQSRDVHEAARALGLELHAQSASFANTRTRCSFSALPWMIAELA
jgi:putative tryptophan/tyrosine transport system substrate-binding protein